MVPAHTLSLLPPPPSIQDRFGRRVTYLRVSLTEHCNFRCQYCSPAEGTPYFDREDHLHPEELDRLLTIFAGLGVRHVRFTGGEPLIYPYLLPRIRHVRSLGVGKISLSTNGYLLERLAVSLREAGVNKLNISLDSLDAARFEQITRGGDLGRVLRGIDAALAAGFEQVKLNAVLLRQGNADELENLLAYAIDRRMDIQFIETMPLGLAGSAARDMDYLPVHEAMARLGRHFHLQPAASLRDHGPARLYQAVGTGTRVGFISPISENFCTTCNRVRLSAQGRLIYCLGQDLDLDLLTLLRKGWEDREIDAAIREGVLRDKPERHHFADDPGRAAKVYMMRVGG